MYLLSYYRLWGITTLPFQFCNCSTNFTVSICKIGIGIAKVEKVYILTSGIEQLELANQVTVLLIDMV